jgi:4-amino-4-deoxychorismate lyase
MDLLRLSVDGSVRDSFPAIGQRAFQYGDGLFETVAVIDGSPCLWRYHLDRLEEGCRRLRLPLPDADGLASEVRGICDGHPRAVLKLYWTAGASQRGYRRPDPLTPQRVLALSAWSSSAGRQWRLRTCEHRLSDNSVLAGIKHLNRLDQVIARAEWTDDTIDEGLMLGQDGNVVSGTMSNLFVQSAGRLSTPRLERAGIAGVVRQLLIDTARATGEPLAVHDHSIDDLAAAEALYLSNSLIGLVRVARWEDRVFDTTIPEARLIGLVRAACHRPDGTAGAAA